MVYLASEFPNDNPSLHCGVIWVCDEPTGPARAERAPVQVALAVVAIDAEPSVDDAAPAPSVAASPPIVEILDDAIDEAPIVVEELEPLEVSVEGAEPEIVAEPDLAAAHCPLPVACCPSPVSLSECPDASASDVTPIFDEVLATPELTPEDISSSALPPPSDDPFTRFVFTLADAAIASGSPHVAAILPGLLFDGRLPEPLDPDVADALRGAGILDGEQVTPAFVTVTAAWRAILRGTSDDFDACGAAMLDEWAADLLARLLASPTRAPSLRQELRSRGIAAFGMAA